MNSLFVNNAKFAIWVLFLVISPNIVYSQKVFTIRESKSSFEEAALINELIFYTTYSNFHVKALLDESGIHTIYQIVVKLNGHYVDCLCNDEQKEECRQINKLGHLTSDREYLKPGLNTIEVQIITNDRRSLLIKSVLPH